MQGELEPEAGREGAYVHDENKGSQSKYKELEILYIFVSLVWTPIVFVSILF